MITDFLDDFHNEYPKIDTNIIDELINAICNDFDIAEFNGFEISCSTEKVNQLQENVFVSVENETENIYFNLAFENGISNGTQLNDYSFENDCIPEFRKVEEFSHVEFDFDEWLNASNRNKKDVSENEKNNILMVFESNFKSEIESMIKKQSYDNYVTGGGTGKTDKYYNEFENKMRSKFVFWKSIYKTERVPVTLS